MALDIIIGEELLVISENELREVVSSAEKYERLFWELLVLVMASGKASRSIAVERWINDNYIDLRLDMPIETRQLYLKEMAFAKR